MTANISSRFNIFHIFTSAIVFLSFFVLYIACLVLCRLLSKLFDSRKKIHTYRWFLFVILPMHIQQHSEMSRI